MSLREQVLRLTEIFGYPLGGMLLIHALYSKDSELLLFVSPLFLVLIRLYLIKPLSPAKVAAGGKQSHCARQAIRAEQLALAPLFVFEVGSLMAETTPFVILPTIIIFVIYVAIRFAGLQYSVAADAAGQKSG